MSSHNRVALRALYKCIYIYDMICAIRLLMSGGRTQLIRVIKATAMIIMIRKIIVGMTILLNKNVNSKNTCKKQNLNNGKRK